MGRMSFALMVVEFSKSGNIRGELLSSLIQVWLKPTWLLGLNAPVFGHRNNDNEEDECMSIRSVCVPINIVEGLHGGRKASDETHGCHCADVCESSPRFCDVCAQCRA